MNNKAKESAVSEVIGVVLIVALTVIMAGIIAAYMFGMLNAGISETRMIAVTAQQVSPSVIQVTYRGGTDAKSLENLTITWPSGAQELIDSPKIGDVYRATNFGPPYNATPDKDRVVVTGNFIHGVSQIVLDTNV
jgi:FlaG/FlaF family flagellin (archaellin)